SQMSRPISRTRRAISSAVYTIRRTCRPPVRASISAVLGPGIPNRHVQDRPVAGGMGDIRARDTDGPQHAAGGVGEDGYASAVGPGQSSLQKEFLQFFRAERQADAVAGLPGSQAERE